MAQMKIGFEYPISSNIPYSIWQQHKPEGKKIKSTVIHSQSLIVCFSE